MIEAAVARGCIPAGGELLSLEVAYAGGDKESSISRDFNSGAMIQKRRRPGQSSRSGLPSDGDAAYGSSICRPRASVYIPENEDLPTTNPTTGRGSRARRATDHLCRTLVSTKSGTEPGRTIDTVSNTGQYL